MGPPSRKTIIYPPWKYEGRIAVSVGDILGSLAKYAVIQSPYDCPDNLSEGLDRLAKRLRRDFVWEEAGSYIHMTSDNIYDYLVEVFAQEKIFLEWNTPEVKASPTRAQKFPENDFMDLYALARNVSHDLVTDHVVWQSDYD